MRRRLENNLFRFRSVVIAAILALSFHQNATAQFLVDEFGELPCVDMAARIEMYVRELAKDSEAPGLVQTFAPKEESLYSLQIESLILGVIESLKSDGAINMDPKRLHFAFNGNEESGRTRLWMMPKGTSTSADEGIEISLTLANDTKPFRFRSTQRVPGGGSCIFGGTNRQFQNILGMNPDARGNLVIADKNREAFRNRQEELLAALSDIAAGRLRFFFVKSTVPYVEYWIVPSRKK